MGCKSGKGGRRVDERHVAMEVKTEILSMAGPRPIIARFELEKVLLSQGVWAASRSDSHPGNRDPQSSREVTIPANN